MNSVSSEQFVSSLSKFLQSLCNGYVVYKESVTVFGHLNVVVDHGESFDYILNEDVNKLEENRIHFNSKSFRARPFEVNISSISSILANNVDNSASAHLDKISDPKPSNTSSSSSESEKVENPGNSTISSTQNISSESGGEPASNVFQNVVQGNVIDLTSSEDPTDQLTSSNADKISESLPAILSVSTQPQQEFVATSRNHQRKPKVFSEQVSRNVSTLNTNDKLLPNESMSLCGQVSTQVVNKTGSKNSKDSASSISACDNGKSKTYGVVSISRSSQISTNSSENEHKVVSPKILTQGFTSRFSKMLSPSNSSSDDILVVDSNSKCVSFQELKKPANVSITTLVDHNQGKEQSESQTDPPEIIAIDEAPVTNITESPSQSRKKILKPIICISSDTPGVATRHSHRIHKPQSQTQNDLYLPDGWQVNVKQIKTGNHKGDYFIEYITPTNTIMRSKKQIQEYASKNNVTLDHSKFTFHKSIVLKWWSKNAPTKSLTTHEGLPSGWQVVAKPFVTGRNKGKYFVQYITPTNTKCYTRKQVQEYASKNNLTVDLDKFGFAASKVFGEAKKLASLKKHGYANTSNTKSVKCGPTFQTKCPPTRSTTRHQTKGVSESSTNSSKVVQSDVEANDEILIRYGNTDADLSNYIHTKHLALERLSRERPSSDRYEKRRRDTSDSLDFLKKHVPSLSEDTVESDVLLAATVYIDQLKEKDAEQRRQIESLTSKRDKKMEWLQSMKQNLASSCDSPAENAKEMNELDVYIDVAKVETMDADDIANIPCWTKEIESITNAGTEPSPESVVTSKNGEMRNDGNEVTATPFRDKCDMRKVYLPAGWKVAARKRSTGLRMGKFEVYYVTPTKSFCHSRKDIRIYAKKNNLDLDHKKFNFNYFYMHKMGVFNKVTVDIPKLDLSNYSKSTRQHKLNKSTNKKPQKTNDSSTDVTLDNENHEIIGLSGSVVEKHPEKHNTGRYFSKRVRRVGKRLLNFDSPNSNWTRVSPVSLASQQIRSIRPAKPPPSSGSSAVVKKKLNMKIQEKKMSIYSHSYLLKNNPDLANVSQDINNAQLVDGVKTIMQPPKKMIVYTDFTSDVILGSPKTNPIAVPAPPSTDTYPGSVSAPSSTPSSTITCLNSVSAPASQSSASSVSTPESPKVCADSVSTPTSETSSHPEISRRLTSGAPVNRPHLNLSGSIAACAVNKKDPEQKSVGTYSVQMFCNYGVSTPADSQPQDTQHSTQTDCTTRSDAGDSRSCPSSEISTPGDVSTPTPVMSRDFSSSSEISASSETDSADEADMTLVDSLNGDKNSDGKHENSKEDNSVKYNLIHARRSIQSLKRRRTLKTCSDLAMPCTCSRCSRPDCGICVNCVTQFDSPDQNVKKRCVRRKCLYGKDTSEVKEPSKQQNNENTNVFLDLYESVIEEEEEEEDESVVDLISDSEDEGEDDDATVNEASQSELVKNLVRVDLPGQSVLQLTSDPKKPCSCNRSQLPDCGKCLNCISSPEYLNALGLTKEMCNQRKCICLKAPK